MKARACLLSFLMLGSLYGVSFSQDDTTTPDTAIVDSESSASSTDKPVEDKGMPIEDIVKYVTMALGIIGSVLGFLGKRNAERIAIAVTSGVEAASKEYAESEGEETPKKSIKATIKEIAEASGIESRLKKFIDKHIG